jgi:RHS repeat-associated protein
MVTSTKTYTYDSNGNMLTYNTTGTDATGNVNRSMLWDEENHLLGVNDNGYVSTYWYDGAGERTVKQSGDILSMAVNGSVAGGTTGTTNFTAYISPYLVVNNGGLYTKHMYVGSQRIMSKLASSDIFAVNPTDASVSKATYTGNTLNFATKYNTLTSTVKARYDSLGVAYNGTQQSSANLITATTAKISTPQQYFYHSDHLGSANYITDANGDVAQHLEFIPDGSVLVDERNSTWHSPFLFNGKEQDEETGLIYYSSRYYDMNGWLSPDDHKERYPNIGAYVYCFGNPVKYRDPDGKDPGDHFFTKDKAANDWGNYYNGKSIMNNKEYSSSIYKDGKQGYTYTPANKGTNDGVKKSDPPKGKKTVGIIHSHGKYEKDYINNDFSNDDLWYSYNNKADIYVTTPNGSLKKYDVHTGKKKTLNEKMPSDPNDPDRKNKISPKNDQKRNNTKPKY